MKKFLSLILAAALMLGLAGCSSQSTGDKVFVDPKANSTTTGEASGNVDAQTQSEKGADKEDSQQGQQEQEASATDSLGQAFVCGDVSVAPLEEAEAVLARLSEPLSTFEADSCAYQGKDYYYYFSGYELTVNEIEGVKRVTAISLVDDTVKAEFPGGLLGIGDTEETLLNVLGGEPGQEYYEYTNDTMQVQVQLTEGVITALVFRSATETAGEE